MRKIKFEYGFENMPTKNIHKEYYSLLDIENGKPLQDADENLEYRLKYRRQYTGLEDKNGVEIYEGDFISCQNKIGQVKYEESMFVVDFERTKGHLFTISDKCEIIGNIYENPELLKED